MIAITCLLALGLILSGCSRDRAGAASGTDTDTGFVALQNRGAQAMGVNQYTSAHRFESLSDGGRIVLTRDPADSVGVATIRAHMRLIASRFAQGDFRIPGQVHAREVPGTAIMAARRDRISYAADTLSGGGEVRITTTDSVALAAVHAFLAFQRREHHAVGQETAR